MGIGYYDAVAALDGACDSRGVSLERIEQYLDILEVESPLEALRQKKQEQDPDRKS